MKKYFVRTFLMITVLITITLLFIGGRNILQDEFGVTIGSLWVIIIVYLILFLILAIVYSLCYKRATFITVIKAVLFLGLPWIVFSVYQIITSIIYIYDNEESVAFLMSESNYESFFTFNSGTCIYSALFVSILIAICDELIFRKISIGLLIKNDSKITIKKYTAVVIINSILFTLWKVYGFYFENVKSTELIKQLIIAFLSSIILTTIYIKYQNLVSVVILHIIWNFSKYCSEVSVNLFGEDTFNKYVIISLTINVVFVCILYIVGYNRINKN